MSAYNTTILGDSPILYATLDDTSGTSCVDSSTTAHNGTYTGSPTKSVAPLIKTGTSVTFSGSGQYAEFTSVAAYTFSGSLSCEAWIKTSTGGTMSILNGDDTGGARVFQFRLNAGKLEMITFAGASGTTKTGSATVNDNVLHHVVGVYDRSAATIKLYVDGAQDGTTATSVAAMNTTQTPLQIAERLSSGSHGQLYTGTIDEAAVYTAALSSGQVSSHFGDGHTFPDKAGFGDVDADGSGVRSSGSNYTKAGFADTDADGFGADEFTDTDSGFGRTGTVGAGTDESVFVKKGWADVAGLGTGSNQAVGHTYSETGAGLVGTIGHGFHPGLYTQSGMGRIGTTGAGARSEAGVQDVPGRVLIAFTAGPLVPDPKWTRIDGADAPFPDQFVSGYDIRSGRQTLLSQTDTGTATVYINDHETGLFDPRNVSSPYYQQLDGRQIRLQLYDPVAEVWEDEFRGWIDDITWAIDGSAVDVNGDPINASIQIECVDMFDILAGYGLTPGLDGMTPRVVPSGSAGGPVPVGFEDGVYYATTDGTNDDRIIEILADVGIPPELYGSPSFASGNTHVLACKYDPDESALQALRDAADADMPFIANIFCDRHGHFQFHGRYARFDPDAVAGEPGSNWDFTRWAVGDGQAIASDSTRAQMRVLSFGRNRSDLINVAICYPQGLEAADMPNQVYADTASITRYGKHSAPPMSDLLLDKNATQPVTGDTGKVECFHYAKLLVLNQKDPRETITALQVKVVRPDDSRAATTWAFLTRADISHIVNVKVGYPEGTGLTGDSPEDDYYIEGRRLMVRPLNPTHDYAELELDVSPAVWSMDTHGVFPAFPGPDAPELTAEFTVAE